MKRGKTKQSKINLKNKTNKTLRVHSSNPEDPVLPGETHESAGILLSCRHKSFGSTFSRSMLAVRLSDDQQNSIGKGKDCYAGDISDSQVFLEDCVSMAVHLLTMQHLQTRLIPGAPLISRAQKKITVICP